MPNKVVLFPAYALIAYTLLSFLNVSAFAVQCDSRVFLDGVNSTEGGTKAFDGYPLYPQKSIPTAETVCVKDKNNGNVRRYIVERVLVGNVRITLTHGFKEVSARAYPDTLDIDPKTRSSEHVVAKCTGPTVQYRCDAFPDPMSMIKVSTYYSNGTPGNIEFTLNAPRREIRRAFKIDHATSTKAATMQLPNGKIILFPYNPDGGFRPASNSEDTVYSFLRQSPDEAVMKIAVPVTLANGDSTLMKTEMSVGQIKLASQISDYSGQYYEQRPR